MSCWSQSLNFSEDSLFARCEKGIPLSQTVQLVLCILAASVFSASAVAQSPWSDPLKVEDKPDILLPDSKSQEEKQIIETKEKQEKFEEKRKTPLVEDPKTDVEGKKIPTGEPQPQALGHKLISIAGVYSANISGAHDDGKSGSFYPMAALLEVGATDSIAFETGLIFVERQYQVANDNYLLQQNVKRLHLPVTLKLWWRDIVGFSVGPYMAFAMSSLQSYEIIRVTDSDDLETPAEDFVEFGFESSFTLNLPLAEKTGVFAEVRYFAPYDTIQLKKYNSVYGLAGFKYQF